MTQNMGSLMFPTTCSEGRKAYLDKQQKSITVHGASDDLIEIEGDIREEFYWIPEAGDTRLLSFSDGTLLRVAYDSDGIWRLNKVASGTSQFSKVEGDVEKDTPDSVTLSGVEINWVVLGEQVAKRA